MRKHIFWIQRKLYYGWMIVLVSAFALFFSAPGQTYSISIFTNQYVTEFGFSRGLLSSIYSIATLISGSLLIFMGKAVDRFGQRRMMIIAAFVLGLTALFSSFVSSLAMIFVSYFFLRYFGQGSMTLIPNSNLGPKWLISHF
jgi:MFS family permease